MTLLAMPSGNLGFIKFEILNQTIIEIELHPRNVDQLALFSVQRQLLSSEIGLFRIKHFSDSAWRSEISSSAEHAIVRLTELCTPAFMPSSSARFSAEPRDSTALFRSSSRAPHPLRIIAQKWRISFGHFDLNVVSLAARHNVQMAIVGVKSRERDPRFRFFGVGNEWAGDTFKAAAPGEKVENMPDKEYGGWASQFFRSVARLRAAALRPRHRRDAVSGGTRQAAAERPLRAAAAAVEDAVG